MTTALRTFVRACTPLAMASAVSLLWATGCSSSGNSAQSNDDAASETSVGPAVLGDPVTDCSACPSKSVCGGTLDSNKNGVSYCTQACMADSDCPSGTACAVQTVNHHCLKQCTGDSQCSGGFVCNFAIQSVGGTGGFCFAYPGSAPPPAKDGGSDASHPPSGDGGPKDSSATPDVSTGPSDASDSGEASEGASDAAAEGGATSDAAPDGGETSDAGDAGSAD